MKSLVCSNETKDAYSGQFRYSQTGDTPMFESARDTRHRDAIRRAHITRGQMAVEFWHMIFPRR